jgi:hypothetical protein
LVVVDVPVLECECTEYSPVASSIEYSHLPSSSCREGGQVDFNVAVRGLVPGFEYELEITWTLEVDQLSQTWKSVKTAETDVYTLRESLVQRNDDFHFGMLAWDAYKTGTDPFRIEVTVRDMLPGLTTEEAQIGIRNIDSSVISVRLTCGTPRIHLAPPSADNFVGDNDGLALGNISLPLVMTPPSLSLSRFLSLSLSLSLSIIFFLAGVRV